MTLMTRDVEVVAELPAGSQVIGLTGIDPANNTIQISQSGTQNGFQLVQPIPAGTNNIGSVTVSNLGGNSTNEEIVVTTAIVVKSKAGTQIAPTAFFADGLSKVKLDYVKAKSPVGQEVKIYKDDGTTQTLIDHDFVSGNGVGFEQTYSDVTKNSITNTAGGDDRFYAEFLNLDKSKDAFGYCLFKFTITP